MSPVVIQGFERNLHSFLESCLTGICLSIIYYDRNLVIEDAKHI